MLRGRTDESKQELGSWPSRNLEKITNIYPKRPLSKAKDTYLVSFPSKKGNKLFGFSHFLVGNPDQKKV